ncbi:MAG: hypothetical protein ACI9UQ_002316 [Candidatus Krumholzibacteriia bacterium]|jgi:hypothetical protein
MALSWKRSSILRGDVVRAARIWQECQMRSLQLSGELTDSTAMHQVRYEDLVSDSKAELDDICDSIGLTPANEMVEFYRKIESVCGDTMEALGNTLDVEIAPALAELEAELVPMERAEKPGWSDVCAEEKELRRARVAVLTRIAAYPCKAC